MSSASGRLVVVDRAGRETRSFPLRGAALATLGSDLACDIRVMLPDVAKHHATIAVHTAQTVIRNVEGAATLVNGAPVSVAALRHGDVITLADRHLRWEYDDPTGRRQPRGGGMSPSLRVATSAAPARGKRRGSDTAAAAGTLHRDRALQLALEMNHRASMPGSSGGKQVAIVQPQRRDTSQQIDVEQSRSSPQPKRRSTGTESPPAGPGPVPAHTTQATLWIESRKTSPRRAKSLQMSAPASAAGGVRVRARTRKSTPLRMAVLKRTHRPSLVKIQAPLTIDYTKQAAIMLMTGHTKSKLGKSPSYVVKKPSPVRKTPRSSRRTLGGASGRTSGRSAPRTPGDPAQRTPGGPAPRTSGATGNRSTKSTGNQSVTILEITDSESRSRRSELPSTSTLSSHKSPALPSPKKSALKDTSKKTSRKIESIKFDLSNLESHQESDVVLLSESTKYSDSNASEEDITLRYSDSSGPTLSPSPRLSIHSRGTRILEKLGASATRHSGLNLERSPSRTLTPTSPSSRSTRGSLMLQKALDGSSLTNYTKSEESRAASAFRTRTPSPRKNMETYSIVDLVSLESNDSSVYSSADSTNTGDYGTPQTSVGRRTRSTIDPVALGSSTPYLGNRRQTRSKSNLTMNVSTRSSISTRRSKSLTTPENKPVSVNSKRVSRRSRSRSRINDSDLLLLDDTEVEDSSPKTSKRPRSTKSNVSNLTEQQEGTSTPENRRSPVEVGTPVLSIQSLLDSSRSSLTSQASKRERRPPNSKRKTIGVPSERRPRDAADGARAASSLGFVAKKTVLRLSRGSSETSDKTDEGAPQPDNEETVTPKSAVKLVPEAVKNKHSTAKKPVSKRSLIDDLDRSDIVKQLFNSPVKRKLSRSMTEFSRKGSFEDDEGVVRVRRPPRNTVAVVTGTVDDSVSDRDTVMTPDRFVSPIQTPTDTPDLSGIKRLFKNNTPNNDLRNVRGVRSLLRTPRTRRSARNDLTNVSGVKATFAKSPRNSLSDVRVKDVFAVGPDNDLRRVTGVKALFRENASPKNDLTNVRGVKRLFGKKSPRNDLTDVKGVRNMYQHQGRAPREQPADVSGIEELFHESNPSIHDSEALFDRLVGKPVIKAVYSKTLSTKKPSRKRPPRRSLHTSIDVITNNVEEWLEAELQKRLHRDKVTKELQRLATDTVQGEDPIRLSRTRNTSMKKSASEVYSEQSLPIKKRSLVQVSLESSRNKLPIKKRAVVHSTPVKGRLHITMNASELGRVSPIALLDRTTEHLRSSRQMPTVEEKAPPPQRAAVEPRTPPRRVTRHRNLVKPTERNAKKRRNSLVISRKTPVMSPKPESDSSNSKTFSSNRNCHFLVRTRSTRARKEKTIETPKKTRTRAPKATVAVVIPKPSPQLKPRRGRGGKQTEPEPKPIHLESPKRSQKGRKAKVDPEPKTEERPPPKRTRKTTARTEPLTAAPEEPPKRTRRGRADLTDSKTEEKTTRRNKKVVIESNEEAPSKPKRGRPKATDNTEDVQPAVKRTRGRRGERQQQEQQQARVSDTTTNTQTKGGKRKATVPEEIPSKLSKSESSKRKATLSKGDKDDSAANETGRGRRKVAQLVESPATVAVVGVTCGRSTRGKKSETTSAVAKPKDNVTEVGTRKRAVSAKEPKKASGAPSPSPSPVRKTRGRGARAALPALESVAPPPPPRAGRSRRR